MITDKNTPTMIAALKNALRYLEHPDMQAIPFALPASSPARQLREIIADLEAAQNAPVFVTLSDAGINVLCETCGFNWAIGGEDEDTRAITAATAYHKAKKGILQ